MSSYLVYVWGLKGPQPEKWPEMLVDMNGQPRPHLVAHRLNADLARLPLDILVQFFPPPQSGEPVSK